MPTYEYACQKCGYEFEKFQSIKDDPIKTCPRCKGKVAKKISTGAGLLFKGSGFYITDYRSDSYKKAASSEASSSSTKSDAKSSGSTTTKTTST